MFTPPSFFCPSISSSWVNWFIYCSSWCCWVQRAACVFDCFSCLFFLKWAAGSLSCFECTMNRSELSMCECVKDRKRASLSEGVRKDGFNIFNYIIIFKLHLSMTTCYWSSQLFPDLLYSSCSSLSQQSSSSSSSLLQEMGLSKLPASVSLTSKWK